MLQMADATSDIENKTAEELMPIGIKAFYLRDYSTAVSAFSKASELIVAAHSDDQHSSLGDVYLLYGKSLLELVREETEALGDLAKDMDGDDDDDDDDEGEVEANAPVSNGAENAEKPKESSEADAATRSHKAKEHSNGSSSNDAEVTSSEANKGAENSSGEVKAEEEEATDLQVAWEVLELAKLIFEKRKDGDLKKLSETYIVLGEVAMESENFDGAVTDIQKGIEIQANICDASSRLLSESYYKLGLALSMNSKTDEAIEAYTKSAKILKARLEKLKEESDANKDEIGELESLIPDLEEKVVDLKSYKEEVCKMAVKTG